MQGVQKIIKILREETQGSSSTHKEVFEFQEMSENKITGLVASLAYINQNFRTVLKQSLLENVSNNFQQITIVVFLFEQWTKIPSFPTKHSE